MTAVFLAGAFPAGAFPAGALEAGALEAGFFSAALGATAEGGGQVVVRRCGTMALTVDEDEVVRKWDGGGQEGGGAVKSNRLGLLFRTSQLER